MRGLLAVAVLGVGCTTIDTARVSADPRGRDLFVTQEDLQEPYESLGPVQATTRGALLFGLWDPAGAELEPALLRLADEARRLGGDGVINVRYQLRQYVPLVRALLCWFPLPTEVNAMGEVVKLRSGARSER